MISNETLNYEAKIFHSLPCKQISLIGKSITGATLFMLYHLSPQNSVVSTSITNHSFSYSSVKLIKVFS